MESLLLLCIKFSLVVYGLFEQHKFYFEQQPLPEKWPKWSFFDAGSLGLIILKTHIRHIIDLFYIILQNTCPNICRGTVIPLGGSKPGEGASGRGYTRNFARTPRPPAPWLPACSEGYLQKESIYMYFPKFPKFISYMYYSQVSCGGAWPGRAAPKGDWKKREPGPLWWKFCSSRNPDPQIWIHVCPQLQLSVTVRVQDLRLTLLLASELHTHTKDQEHADAGWWEKSHRMSQNLLLLILTSIWPR